MIQDIISDIKYEIVIFHNTYCDKHSAAETLFAILFFRFFLGCVYGKGNQYSGKANVTISGNACLPWADEKIAHQLRVNVSLLLYA